MMRTLRLELPYLPPAEYGANRSRGAAWQRQYRVSHGMRGAADEIIALAKAENWQGPPMQRAVVMVTFYLPDQGRRDGLGLLERLKPWVDGLVVAGVIQDDDLPAIGFPIPDFKYRPHNPGTTIEVVEG